MTIGNSHSHSLEDFVYENNSDAAKVMHTIRMQQLGDGQPFDGPDSLVNTLQNPFIGAQLRPLPSLATANIPLIAQAFWQSGRREDLVEYCNLIVKVRHHLLWVQATNNFFTFDSNFRTTMGTYQFTLPVDLTVVPS